MDKYSNINMNIILLTFISAAIAADDYDMKMALNYMEEHFQPGKEFSPSFLEHLEQCMNKYDDTILLDASNEAWKEMNVYWLTNGTDKDHWGSKFVPGGSQKTYLKHEPEIWDPDNMIIYETCNYVSNIAYYHGACRLCDYPNWTIGDDYVNAMKRGFSTLAFGSAFMHGAHTSLG